MYGNKSELGFPVTSRKEKRGFCKKMQSNPTAAEMRFAQRLESAGIPFKTQKIVGFYIADFFITDRIVVIEIDGGYHDTPWQQQKDRHKDEFLKKSGVPIFRIRNEDVDRWPLGNILKYAVKTQRHYQAIMGRMGREKGLREQKNGWATSIRERRAIRKHYGLRPDAPLSWDVIKKYRDGL